MGTPLHLQKCSFFLLQNPRMSWQKLEIRHYLSSAFVSCLYFVSRPKNSLQFPFINWRQFFTSVVFWINRSSKCDNFTVLLMPSHLQQDTFAFLAKVQCLTRYPPFLNNMRQTHVFFYSLLKILHIFHLIFSWNFRLLICTCLLVKVNIIK